MVDLKISQLPLKATPAGTDELPINNVAGGPATKKITIGTIPSTILSDTADIAYLNTANIYSGGGTQDFAGAALDNISSLTSNATTPAASGVIRLGNNERIEWKNITAGNNAIVGDSDDDITLLMNGVAEFVFNIGFLDTQSNDIIVRNGQFRFNIDVSFQQVGSDIQYDTITGGAHVFRVNDVTEYTLSASALTVAAGNNILMSASGALGYLEMGVLTTPSTPANGFGRYYVKEVATITTPFFIGDDGTEIDLTAGGGSPLTTKGDIFGFDSADARIPVGADNLVLMADSAETLGVKYALVANANVAAAAAIDYSKLATLTSGNILVGSAGNVATSVAMSGDVNIINSGATTIQVNAVDNGKIASHTSTKITITAKGQLNSNIVYTDQINTFGAFETSFLSGRFQWRDSDNTNNIQVVTNLESTDRTITIPVLGGNQDLVLRTLAQTLTGKTIDLDSNTITGTVAEFNTALQSETFSMIGTAETRAAVMTFTSDPVFQDNVKIFTGTGSDASIYYDGTDQNYDSQEVGTGNHIFRGGDIELEGGLTFQNSLTKQFVYDANVDAIDPFTFTDIGGTGTDDGVQDGIDGGRQISAGTTDGNSSSLNTNDIRHFDPASCIFYAKIKNNTATTFVSCGITDNLAFLTDEVIEYQDGFSTVKRLVTLDGGAATAVNTDISNNTTLTDVKIICTSTDQQMFLIVSGVWTLKATQSTRLPTDAAQPFVGIISDANGTRNGTITSMRVENV